MSARKMVTVQGDLQVGEGRESPLFGATVNRPYGATDKVDILWSANSRHVWTRLDTDSARALARRILEELGDGETTR